MFSNAAIRWPQPGHCDRGTIRLYLGSSATGCPDSSAHCVRQPRSSIFGRRWMTTLRKLPTQRPITPATTNAATGSVSIAGMRQGARASDHRPQLEDRKVHGDDQAADHDAEK